MGKKCAQAMNLETQPTRKDQHTRWLKSVQLRKKLTRASTHMRRNVEPKIQNGCHSLQVRPPLYKPAEKLQKETVGREKPQHIQTHA